ncbi:hypothetical protein Fmac_015877 [Flemingia macrophylla]|uniref:PRA1 family protein n=1 Tax=Flemingia macrophylla TaxID=520843 RepID=A0ABD1MFS5_9FABA
MDKIHSMSEFVEECGAQTKNPNPRHAWSPNPNVDDAAMMLLIVFLILLWHLLSMIVFFLLFVAWFYFYLSRIGPLVILNQTFND